MYENYTGLKIERRGRVLHITMSNPPMNAMTRQMHLEFARIFHEINFDKETAVVVLTGEGKSFSAGGDIQKMASNLEKNSHADWHTSMVEAKHIIGTALRLERPLISRINGPAMGLGSTLAVLSDFSFALDTAKIADTHVKVGLTAGDGGALLWPLLIGPMRAKRYLMTGKMLTGKEAAEIGLITESAATIEELDAKVNAMVDELLEVPTFAVNYTKASVNLVMRKMLEGAMEAHLGWETLSYLTADHREAAFAFRDKRKPNFTGG